MSVKRYRLLPDFEDDPGCQTVSWQAPSQVSPKGLLTQTWVDRTVPDILNLVSSTFRLAVIANCQTLITSLISTENWQYLALWIPDRQGTLCPPYSHEFQPASFRVAYYAQVQ